MPGASAVLDQHISELEAGAPVSLHGAQRGDQHHSRQRQLDERSPVCAGEPAIRRQDRQAVSCDRSGRERLGFDRQRGGVLVPVGAVAAACDGHADSRGVGGQSGDGPEEARVLRVPCVVDGAVGRAGVGVFHRWARGWCDAGPQRFTARAVHRDQGRSGGAGVGGGRHRGAAGGRAQEGPVAAGADVPGGYGGAPDYFGCWTICRSRGR